jgi:hypothetical protein
MGIYELLKPQPTLNLRPLPPLSVARTGRSLWDIEALLWTLQSDRGCDG